jgi:hypothetical protein
MKLTISYESDEPQASVDIAALGSSGAAAALVAYLFPYTQGTLVSAYVFDSVLSLLAKHGPDIHHLRAFSFYYERSARDALLAVLLARGGATPPDSADAILAYFELARRAGDGPVRLGAADVRQGPAPSRQLAFPSLSAAVAAPLLAALDTPISAFVNATGATYTLCALRLVVDAPPAFPDPGLRSRRSR